MTLTASKSRPRPAWFAIASVGPAVTRTVSSPVRSMRLLTPSESLTDDSSAMCRNAASSSVLA
ncbi:Uncharacterised protein [Mycobacteroides abscessus]|nr:Uncharacterised protein [Mycobacteroides abscessus]